MAKKPETKLKDRVWPLLKQIPNSEWIKTQMVSVRGVPDWVGCVNGFGVFIEMKAENGSADALQKYRLTRFSRAGAYTAILDPHNMYHILDDLRHLAASEKPLARIKKRTYY